MEVKTTGMDDIVLHGIDVRVNIKEMTIAFHYGLADRFPKVFPSLLLSGLGS